MLWTIAIIFILLWVIGLVTSTMLGGFIHVLVGAAILLLFIRIIKDRSQKKPDYTKSSRTQKANRKVA